MGSYFQYKVKSLFPAYFAMVMTTGILSVDLYLLGWPILPEVLLGFNIIVYLVLWLMTFTRLVRYFPRFQSDLSSHHKGAGFFTLVAGTCVLGSEILMITGNVVIPFILWIIAIFLWVVVMYTFFTFITIRQEKPSLAEGINGAWLIAAVGTQAVSVLGTSLAPSMGDMKEIVLFFTLCMYFLGCMLYLNIMTLIFYRFTFLKLDFEAITPPYWINMGAVAITTLAGATLILNVDQSSLLMELEAFVKGFTIFFWIAGTWWIPLLFILGFYRHIVHRFPFTYDPQYWAMAFPLAMYTAGTWQLSKALQLDFLEVIPQGMIYIAILVYLAVLYGFFHHLFTDYRQFKKS